MRRVSSFHDPRFFPAYHELPPEQDVDLRFFGSTDGTIFFPRRHWCFLGEITQVEHNDDELRVLVRDRAGMLVVVGFGQEASSEILSTLVIGHTMAILYAYGNAFMGMSIGIRVQDPSEVKILPIGIDHLIAISDRARRYAPTEDMMSVCHGCGHRARLVLKCGRCGFFRYCDRECQTRGWIEKRHKLDCRVLRDSDLQAMLKMDWDHFKGLHVAFPLKSF